MPAARQGIAGVSVRRARAPARDEQLGRPDGAAAGELAAPRKSQKLITRAPPGRSPIDSERKVQMASPPPIGPRLVTYAKSKEEKMGQQKLIVGIYEKQIDIVKQRMSVGDAGSHDLLEATDKLLREKILLEEMRLDMK